MHLDAPGGVIRAENGVSYHLNAGETPGLVGESGRGKSVAALSFLPAHGEADPRVPVTRSREAEAAFRAALFPVETLDVPHLGHGICHAGIAIASAVRRKPFQ